MMTESVHDNALPAAIAPTNVSSYRDWVGIVASVGCAIHCAAMPFVLAFLPALGLSFLADEAFHQWMALICFVVALAAFIPGYRQHRRWLPGGIAVLGLVTITSASLGLAGHCCTGCEVDTKPVSAAAAQAIACTDECCESEHNPLGERDAAGLADLEWMRLSGLSFISQAAIAGWITPVGGMLLVSAHLLNRRYSCRCCPESEADARGGHR